ncbi:NAD-dependent epimerase/dehydratase family protein [Desulfobaculum bizertense]|uniref:UDP-glucose 4-epimerase n=1 Tax=Desulfobaculum bizertense DSM 18034 TaxID=1121442 RepID=A0A1T4VQT7_9BACT|nr:NAD-dependent epimerase/dehydratase family protein [Desulfobaculum bizertense]SKA67218.1 UDP-glucose 4-epimerase [Desulfobaculum bizertense DSM 18034]
MQKILITGGCGFIGCSLIKRLTKRPEQVQIRILDSFLTGTPEDLEGIAPAHICDVNSIPETTGIFIVEGDIRDSELMLKCAKGCDAIVHLAANTGVGPSVENPRLDMESNVIGIFNALEAARIHGVKRFVFASSGAPAGEVEPPIHEELPPHPVSPYGASKLAGEGYCSCYAKTFGVETVCLRFGNVFGPLSKKKSSVVAKFIRQAVQDEECVIYGSGNQTRDFIYIDDLISAAEKALFQEGIGGETFQIASGKEHTVLEVAEIIKEELLLHDIPMRLSHDSPRLGDVERNYSDTSKAQKLLGWTADYDLRQGIRNTIEYFLGTTR